MRFLCVVAGVGVYISRVEEGSVAERSGLRPGDTILEVNGTPFTAIGHEEALKVIKSFVLFGVSRPSSESWLATTGWLFRKSDYRGLLWILLVNWNFCFWFAGLLNLLSGEINCSFRRRSCWFIISLNRSYRNDFLYLINLILLRENWQ